ncbi:MAG: dephospho-CoA kinase [Candidatus Omnitrophica bacterium]|nr:dephospho-CoA kinase [Candidatus Omnitrophota bacterium]
MKRTKKKKQKPLRVIGLTGGFCSGKSTVLRLFRACGAHTFDCDHVAHKAFFVTSPVYKKIVRAFGKAILTKRRGIDKKALGEIVFNNKSKRKRLERIIHPFVVDQMKTFIQKKKGILVIEVPLLFEARLEKLFDATVVVCCNQSTILERAQKKYRSLSLPEIKARINAQMPLVKKKRKADFSIDNYSAQTLMKDVLLLWFHFKKTHKINK